MTCMNPVVTIHDSKLKVDGISKYLSNSSFEMDHTFDEYSDTQEIYKYSVQSLVPFVIVEGEPLALPTVRQAAARLTHARHSEVHGFRPLCSPLQ